MRIIRLLPDDPGAWELFEDFQNRCRAFIKRYMPETNEVLAIQMLREKWVRTPLDTGYWIGLHDDSNTSFGHLCGYLDAHFDVPYVQFWQIEMIDVPFALQAISQVGREVAEWIAGYNRLLATAGRTRFITYGESQTWIEPKLYERLFRNSGLDLKAHRYVYRWSLKESE